MSNARSLPLVCVLLQPVTANSVKVGVPEWAMNTNKNVSLTRPLWAARERAVSGGPRPTLCQLLALSL